MKFVLITLNSVAVVANSMALTSCFNVLIKSVVLSISLTYCVGSGARPQGS